jgi:hypothetical protein
MANDGQIQIRSDGLNKGTSVIFSMQMDTVPGDELSESVLQDESNRSSYVDTT